MGEKPDQIVTVPAGQPVQQAQPADEKHALLRDLAKKISALDNPVKLNILSLLVESGSLSITDIAKKLDINFSTAHKYLEQLEESGLVKSKQVAENRLKRVFTIQNFAIELSPKSLFQKSAEASNGKGKARFRLFDSYGLLVDFDEEKFAQKYIKRGMPRGTFLLALQEVLPEVYDGMTLLELKNHFRRALEKKSANIDFVLHQLDTEYNHKRTHEHLLSVVHPEALQMHTNGYIFIKNLLTPKLLNFVHSVRGIAEHGVNGQKPANLRDILNQILLAIEKAKSFTIGSQAIDSFNYSLASYISKEDNLQICFEEFITNAEKLGILLFLDLELGKPKIFEDTEHAPAEKIANTILNILKNKKSAVTPVIKAWDKKYLGQDFSDLPVFYLVNMCQPWQTENISLVDGCRFDSEWRGVLRTDRVGEAQEIAINLPRIAAETKTPNAFLAEIGNITKKCVEFNLNIMELTVGELLRKCDMRLPSAKYKGGYWNFVSIADLAYNLSVIGLPEAVKILTGSDIKKELKFAQKILQTISNNLVPKDYTPIRMALKDCKDHKVAARFGILNSKHHKNETNCSFESPPELQPYLKGGHTWQLDKKEYKSHLAALSKTKFGTLCVK